MSKIRKLIHWRILVGTFAVALLATGTMLLQKPLAASTSVVISEFRPGAGSFLEFYNKSASPVSLAGWSIQIINGDWETMQGDLSSVTIPAYGFFSMGNTAGVDANIPVDFIQAEQGFRLKNGVTVVDTVVWGSTDFLNAFGNAKAETAGFDLTTNSWSAGKSIERKACSSDDTAVQLATGGAKVSKGNGYDTDNNASDFVVQATPSVQKTTSAIENNNGNCVHPAMPNSYAPSAVTLADNDTAYGIFGEDFAVSWTPGTTHPSFNHYGIHILPNNGTTLNTSSHNKIDMRISAADSAWTGWHSMVQDSTNTAISDTGSYVACVTVYTLIDSTLTALDGGTRCSSATTITKDSGGTDTTAPNIMTMGITRAVKGQKIRPIIEAVDNRETISYAKMFVREAASGNYTEKSCTQLSGRYYYCEHTVGANATTLQYYFSASDGTNVGYKGQSWDSNPNALEADRLSSAQGSPFNVPQLMTLVQYNALSTYSIAGRVTSGSSSTNLAGAYVWIQGEGVYIDGTHNFYTITATGENEGTYTLANIPAGNYDVTAGKTGYGVGGTMRANALSGNASGINLNLPSGNFVMMEENTNTGDLNVTWSMPCPNCNIPAGSTTLEGGFSKQVSAGTVNDSDISNAGSNIYVLDSAGTQLSGSVIYNTESNFDSSGFWGAMSDNGNYKFTLTLTSSLTASQEYYLILTENILSATSSALKGNTPGTGHVIPFRADSNNYSSATEFKNSDNFQNFGQNAMFMPPWVSSSSPNDSATGVPTNGKIILTFSEPIATASVSTNNFKLGKVAVAESQTYDETYSASEWTLSEITVTQDVTDSRRIILQPTTLTKGIKYFVLVLGNVISQGGVPMSSSNDAATRIMYRFNFTTTSVGSGADSTPPTVRNSYPASGATGVDININPIEINFSEAMDPATLSASSVSLKSGSNSVPATLTYQPYNNALMLSPTQALNPNTTYTLVVSTTVKDTSGLALAASNSRTFTTTSGYDSAAPTVMYGKGDDCGFSLTFSEAMNRDGMGTTNYTSGYSVLKPSNYAVTYGLYDNPTANPVTSTGATISYDPLTNSIDFDFASCLATDTRGKDLKIVVNNVTDLSLNAISNTAASKSAQFPIENSAETGGMRGPTMMGGATMGPMTMGQDGDFNAMQNTGFGTHTAADMGMMPINVMPMNMMAGQSSLYNVNIPLTSSDTALVDGDTIILSFPSGFDVTNAKKDLYSPMLNDFNNMSTGTITFDNTVDTDGIEVNTSARTVTVTLDITGTPTVPDYLNFSLKGIVNSTIARDWTTSGYSVDIKVKRPSTNKILKSETSMPFFIQAAGENTLTVNVYLKDTSGSTLTGDVTGTNSFILMGGSPMTGPLDKFIGPATDADTNFSSGLATVTFAGMPDGEYYFSTEPTISLTVGGQLFKFNGQMFPEPKRVSGNTTINLNLNQQDTTNAPQVRLVISASANTFSAAGENVDIFASSPSGGYNTETVAVNNNTTSITKTLYLSRSGDWMLGVGPAMPKGVQMGPPPMPDWMSPPPVDVTISGTGTATSVASRWGNLSYGVTIDTSTNPDTINIALRGSNYQIIGKILDGASSAIADADVGGHQSMMMGSMGGSGAHTRTNADGTFTLKASELGNWEMFAWKPGLPQAMANVEIKTNTGASDGNSTADVYKDGQLITASNQLIIKMKKPDYTISGKVSDSSGNAIQYAPVWAESTTFGHAGTSTDNNGNYILYVDAGAWTLNSEMPYGTNACGTLTATATVATTSLANQNLTPSSSTCYSITGTLTGADSSPLANKPVFIEFWDITNDRPSGGYHRDAMSNSSGVYSVQASNGTYLVRFWQDGGELTQTVTVNGANATANFNLASGTFATKTLTITITGGTSDMRGFLDAKKTGSPGRRGQPISNASQTYALSLSAGTYKAFLHLDGVGDFASTSIDLTDDNSYAFNVGTATTRYAISGTVKDSNDNLIANTFVWLGNSSGFNTGSSTDSDGAYTFKVPAGTYDIGANKANYISPAPASLTVSANTTYDFDTTGGLAGTTNNPLVSTTGGKTISGTIYGTSVADANRLTNIWVQAEKQNGNQWNAGFVGDMTDANGDFSIGVPASATGDVWRLKVFADGYAEYDTNRTGGLDNITITSSDSADNNITLTVDSTRTKQTISTSVTPTVGKVMEDADAGIKITIPPQALGSSSSAGTVSLTKTYAVASTSSAAPLGGGFEISAVDSAGTTISTLNSAIDVTITYTDAQLTTAGITEDKLSGGYWDNSSNQWVKENCTVNTDDNTITCSVSHLTAFGGYYPPASGSSSTGGRGDRRQRMEQAEIDAATQAAQELAQVPAKQAEQEVQILEETQSVETPLLQSIQFKDLAKSHWAHSAVEQLIQKGVLSGYADKTFKPNQSITRAELVKIALKAFGIAVPEKVEITSFKDVAVDSWAAPYVKTAKELGIAPAAIGKTFRPERSSTRAEALQTILGASGLDLGNYTASFKDIVPGSDLDSYIGFAVAKGIVKGYTDNTFKPSQTITRAEIAKITTKVLELKTAQQVRILQENSNTNANANLNSNTNINDNAAPKIKKIKRVKSPIQKVLDWFKK